MPRYFTTIALALSMSCFPLAPTTSALPEPDTLHTIIDDAWVGTANSAPRAHFSGRLTRNRPAPDASNGRLGSFYRNTRLLLTSGEDGRITWRVGVMEWTLRADDHGYWELVTNQPLDLAPGWHPIDSVHPAASSQARFLVPDPHATFGIISDVDDTILVSHVLQKRKLLGNSLSVPPNRREAVPGMAALYRTLLQRHAPGADGVPVFYVSASPRQLTDNLRAFLALNEFPTGVLQLKEMGGDFGESLNDQQSYKRRRLEAVFEAFPQVRFMLFGDDGESDPEIFREMQGKYPRQISRVWIRRVHTDPTRKTYEGQEDVALLLAGKAQP